MIDQGAEPLAKQGLAHGLAHGSDTESHGGFLLSRKTLAAIILTAPNLFPVSLPSGPCWLRGNRPDPSKAVGGALSGFRKRAPAGGRIRGLMVNPGGERPRPPYKSPLR